MKTLFGGIVAAIIGIIGLIVWWANFLEILKGLIPILLVIGGALAIYLAIDDIKAASSQPKGEEKKEP